MQVYIDDYECDLDFFQLCIRNKNVCIYVSGVLLKRMLEGGIESVIDLLKNNIGKILNFCRINYRNHAMLCGEIYSIHGSDKLIMNFIDELGLSKISNIKSAR